MLGRYVYIFKNKERALRTHEAIMKPSWGLSSACEGGKEVTPVTYAFPYPENLQ